MKKFLFYVSELYAFSIVRPLQAAILARGDRAAWFLEDSKRLSPWLRFGEKQLNTVDSVLAYRPHAVFVPGNTVPDFFPGIKVEIFHGFHARKRSSKRGHFRVRGFFDLYCTQGPDTTGPFKALAQKHGFFEVVETGWPKMDPLFSGVPEPDEKKEKPRILFTSTFTPRLSAAPVLLETIRRLAAGGRWKWMVNFHPKMDRKVVEKYKRLQDENLTLVETDDIIPLLKSADCMLSDTTSVISEFILLHKPVVTFNNRAPAPHMLNVTDTGRLEAAVAHALTRPAPLMEEIRAYAGWIHPYRDGWSSYRVLEAADRLIQSGRGHLRKKPLNLLRRIKIRRKLGYYRI